MFFFSFVLQLVSQTERIVRFLFSTRNHYTFQRHHREELASAFTSLFDVSASLLSLWHRCANLSDRLIVFSFVVDKAEIKPTRFYRKCVGGIRGLLGASLAMIASITKPIKVCRRSTLCKVNKPIHISTE